MDLIIDNIRENLALHYREELKTSDFNGKRILFLSMIKIIDDFKKEKILTENILLMILDLDFSIIYDEIDKYSIIFKLLHDLIFICFPLEKFKVFQYFFKIIEKLNISFDSKTINKSLDLFNSRTNNDIIFSYLLFLDEKFYIMLNFIKEFEALKDKPIDELTDLFMNNYNDFPIKIYNLLEELPVLEELPIFEKISKHSLKKILSIFIKDIFCFLIPNSDHKTEIINKMTFLILILSRTNYSQDFPNEKLQKGCINVPENLNKCTPDKF